MASKKKAKSGKDKKGLQKLKYILWDKSPIIRFSFLFSILIGLFYAYWSGVDFDGPVLGRIVRANARISSWLLSLIGYGTEANNEIVQSPDFSVSIKAGCDGIEPTAFFVAATLAFPMRLIRKVPAILIGVPVLLVLNIFRVLTLFMLGVHAPDLFELFHVGVWQALFIGIGIALWMIWVVWANKKEAAI